MNAQLVISLALADGCVTWACHSRGPVVMSLVFLTLVWVTAAVCKEALR